MLGSLSKAEQMAISDLGDVRPGAWIVCDDPGQRGELEDAAREAGLRPAVLLGLAEAGAALRDRPDGSLLIVELGDAADAGVDALLDRIEVEAQWRARAAVVGFGADMLDHVCARLTAPFATLLCTPTLTERVAAIGYASVATGEAFHEVDNIRDTMRLHQIAEEVGRIARALAGHAADGAPRAVSDGLIGYRAGPADVASQASAATPIRAEDVRAIIRLRRQRDRMFPADLFADPAWDMMLDLMAARIERLKVAVSSLCIAAAVPPTTALRWIRTLTDLGIFVRVADPTDGRRVFIELSDAAAAKILDFLGEAKRAGAPV